MRTLKEPASKRGQKEAISLKRRRLMKTIARGISVTGACVAIITTLYLWRSGQIEIWIDNAETKVEDSLVDAGLTVEKLIIEGELQTSEETLEASSAIVLGEALLLLDIKSIKEKVEELTWIKAATITRKLPDGVVISVVEHVPAALWQVENKLWILSDEGVQITDENLEYFSDLPMISGVGADKELESLLTSVSGNAELFGRVETASWIGGRRWDLILKNGIKIMLPEGDMSSAWQTLVTFEIKEKLLARNILAVDFRLKDKTVVRLTPKEAARRRLMAKTNGIGEEI